MEREKIPDDVRYGIVMAYNQKCACCGEYHQDEFFSTRYIVIDHIIPISFNQEKNKEEKNKYLRSSI